MAKVSRIVYDLTDDLTGEASDDVVTRRFGILGQPGMEIDLGPENNAQFDKDCAAYGELLEQFYERADELMGRYVRAGRRIDYPKPNLKVVKGGKRGSKGGKPTLTPAEKERKRIEFQRMKANLRALGYPVADRGVPRAAWVEAAAKGIRYGESAPEPSVSPVKKALAKGGPAADVIQVGAPPQEPAKKAPAKKTPAKVAGRKAA